MYIFHRFIKKHIWGLKPYRPFIEVNWYNLYRDRIRHRQTRYTQYTSSCIESSRDYQFVDLKKEWPPVVRRERKIPRHGGSHRVSWHRIHLSVNSNTTVGTGKFSLHFNSIAVVWSFNWELTIHWIYITSM